MSKRNPHKKSRTGCSTCKSRHVKCDETGNPCANCKVRDLECDFERAPSIETTPGRSEANYTIAAVGSKRLELELLHQWTSETYRSLLFKDGDENIWQKLMPQTALEHDHLLYSIFALASLHLHSTRSSSLSRAYRRTALEYQNLAIVAFAAEERCVTPSTSQTLFAFATINVILSLAFPCSQDQDSPTSIVESLNTMLELLRGTVSIFTSGRSWLSNGPFGSYISRPLQLQHLAVDTDSRAAFDRLRSLRDEDYNLRSVSVESSSEAVYLYECMTDAIEHLEHCFGLGGDHGQIVPFSWLAMLQIGFIDAVGKYEPLPLLVTMHWAILLNQLSRERWWAKSSGKKLVAELTAILLPSKPEWHYEIAWVHGQVGLPPPSSTLDHQ